jgi:hypothetical protein
MSQTSYFLGRGGEAQYKFPVHYLTHDGATRKAIVSLEK